MKVRAELRNINERLQKVVRILEPHPERGGRTLDWVSGILEDNRWLATQLAGALDELDRLTTPKEIA